MLRFNLEDEANDIDTHLSAAALLLVLAQVCQRSAQEQCTSLLWPVRVVSNVMMHIDHITHEHIAVSINHQNMRTPINQVLKYLV